MSIKSDWDTYLSNNGVTLNPYQEVAGVDLLDLPKLANLTWCRDSGKTFLMGNLAFFLMYRYGWSIIVAAPVLGQASHIMDEAGAAAYRTCNRRKVHASSATVRIKGRPGKIVSVTGSIHANKQGAKGHIVIIDEKQDMSGTQAAEDFIGMKIRGGCMWLVGVGGCPTSAGEMFRGDGAYISELPWQEYGKWDTDYIEEKVEPARKLSLPEQFAAHYECKPLDMGSHQLISHMAPYTIETESIVGITTVGVDWGKRKDKSVATVVTRVGDMHYITAWLRPTGTYDEQMDQLVQWLKNDVDYDFVVSEDVGVGDTSTDFLIRAMKDADGYDSGVSGHGVSSKWISEQAQRLNRMTGNGTLLYNANHPLADMFVKDMLQIEYKILDNNLIKLPSSGQKGHSDFASSLILSIDEPGKVYV